ncbi:MAG: DUF1080 domain-containing protein [Sedimentisphaerales bacterium]|nr:DUF1080 domain-containing protein [Sedimentisphaerales bacterium]
MKTFRSGAIVFAVVICGVSFFSGIEPAFGLNQPPEGFKALFNGEDLTGWKGLVESPNTRAKMSREELAAKQAKADEEMKAHWSVVDGALVFDGGGHSLCTAKDYGDFEMFVDWKIEAGGDSGIYLRGSPQVQIWDTANRSVGAQVGSGGLYNNQKNPSKPSKVADKPIGQWNTFRIKMVGERVTVRLNDVLVVDNVVMENYWERDKPIYPTGQIELQSHGSKLYFRNVFIREIKNELRAEEKEAGFKQMFNGKDLTGWQGNTTGYVVKDGMIVVEPSLGGENLYTEREYANFIMRFEFKLTPGANNGLGIRTPMNVDAAYQGMELQILDNLSPKYSGLRPYQYHGSIYDVVAADETKKGCLKVAENWNEKDWKDGGWNYEEVVADGKKVRVKVNGETLVDADISTVTDSKVLERHPGLNNEKGYIGFCGHGDKLAFRNLRIKILD